MDGAEQVLVRVHAVCVTPEDVAFVRGELRDITGPQPARALGTVCTGTVASAGGALAQGTRVAVLAPLVGRCSGGVCAELAVVPCSACVPLPVSLGFAKGAAAAYAGTAALELLHGALQPHRGDTLLVTAASSPVGAAVVQLAATQYGAAVIAAVDGPTAAARIAVPGVRIVDVAQESIVGAVTAATRGLGAQHIADVALAPSPAQALAPRRAVQVLAPHGRWALCRTGVALTAADTRLLRLKGAAVAFAGGPAWGAAPLHQGVRLHLLKRALELAAAGALDVPVAADGPRPLTAVNDALAAVARDPDGPAEIVLLVPEEP